MPATARAGTESPSLGSVALAMMTMLEVAVALGQQVALAHMQVDCTARCFSGRKPEDRRQVLGAVKICQLKE